MLDGSGTLPDPGDQQTVYRDKDIERIFRREASRRRYPALQHQALRKLLGLNGAEVLQDLRVPPRGWLEEVVELARAS